MKHIPCVQIEPSVKVSLLVESSKEQINVESDNRNKRKKYGTLACKTCGNLLGMEDKWLQWVALSARAITPISW